MGKEPATLGLWYLICLHSYALATHLLNTKQYKHARSANLVSSRKNMNEQSE